MENELISGHHPAAMEIVKAFGINFPCISIDFHLDSESFAVIDVKGYLTVEGAREFNAIVRRFNLVEDEASRNRWQCEFNAEQYERLELSRIH